MKSFFSSTLQVIAVALIGLASLAVLTGCGSAATSPLKPGAVTPMAVALNPTTHRFYVPNGGADTVSVFDDTTNSTVATVSVQPDGVWPTGIAVNPVANKVYVTNYTSGNLSVIDGATNSVNSVPLTTGEGALGGGDPLGVAYNSVTNRVYVLDWLPDGTTNNLYVLDGTTYKVAAQIPVGGSQTGVAVNTQTNTIYATGAIVVSGISEDVLSVINGSENTLVQNIVIPGNMGVVVDEATNTVYVLTINAVVAINGSTNQVTATIPLVGSPVGNRPGAIAINPVTQMIYVAMQAWTGIGSGANPDNKAITMISAASNTVTGTVVLPDFPNGVTVDPTTNLIYAAEDSEITVINGTTLALTHLPVN
jgi:YVTN family beta-propeller protein